MYKGIYEGVYQKPDFKKSDDEHDRIDRVWDKAAAEAVYAACTGQPAGDRHGGEEGGASRPPRRALYDLTTLQREAEMNNRWS